MLSPAAADALGLSAVPLGYLLDTAGSPTDRQIEMLTDELYDIGPMSAQVATADPPSDQRPMLLLLAVASGVITLGAAAVATGLAAAEGRRDLSTLAAVGADPRVRRLLSLCQAGVIAVLGSALGIVAGLGSAAVVLAGAQPAVRGLLAGAAAVPGDGARRDARRAGRGAAGGDGRRGAVHPVPPADRTPARLSPAMIHPSA